MAEEQKVQEFIALRSKGLSFGRIAEQLGVAKSPLIIPKCPLACSQNRPISVSFGHIPATSFRGSPKP